MNLHLFLTIINDISRSFTSDVKLLQTNLPAIERVMLIRTAWGLMFKHTAIGRCLRGRSHLCLVEPNFVLDLLSLLLRHAPEFNGCNMNHITSLQYLSTFTAKSKFKLVLYQTHITTNQQENHLNFLMCFILN